MRVRSPGSSAAPVAGSASSPIPGRTSTAAPGSTPSPWQQLRRVLRRLRRRVLAHRRSLAAVFAALAVLAAVRAASTPAVASVPVLVAATELGGGTTLEAGDLTTSEFRVDSVPEGTLRTPAAAEGRLLAAPVRRGEPITDLRLVAPGLLTGYPGQVAAPVRVADAQVVSLLRVGDVVEVVAADPEGRGSDVVARAAPVIAVPAADDRDLAVQSGGLVVLAVSEPEALDLARLSVTSVLSVLLSP